MYIIAIAWIYVVGVMAAAADSLIYGVLTFVLGGVLPLALMAAVFGRRRRSDEPADGEVGQQDRSDAQADE